mmetsp:Transcript_10147/g.13412  ORF Transcript_10147/g.13412 Transcript_10147/m.13412 type:complete len:166 (-) Transcript_10147:151-648(-)|eukprot:CAMPEP_0198137526 /NCGR_PEP_ID=MMETSP1443-20131203/996_1 /TAXON_ID=186043 /ORGANISM="Entomoneis sp., Strain CCMP2396" /LENGTH=165 /DNA_ID=CAMNT_0043798979 /DNA_START=79 /DNA_END=576 /DNA_ORIENTATION=-
MKSFTAIIASVFLLFAGRITSARELSGKKEKKSSGKKEKKSITLYSDHLHTHNVSSLQHLGKTPMYGSYDVTNGFSEPLGQVFLLVFNYNYPDIHNFLNDNKIQFAFDSGDLVVIQGIYDGATLSSVTNFAITGGAGVYSRARGEAIITNEITSDGYVNIYNLYF